MSPKRNKPIGMGSVLRTMHLEAPVIDTKLAKKLTPKKLTVQVTPVTAWQTSDGLIFGDKKQAQQAERNKSFELALSDLLIEVLGGGELFQDDVASMILDETRGKRLFDLMKLYYK